VLRRADFDALEFDAALTGDHSSAAERMSELAVTGTQSESMPRAEAFVRAGEQWLLAGDPAAAASRFQMAIADGGTIGVDPRVPLARALFLLGNGAESRSLIGALDAEGTASPRACEQVAELLLEQMDLPGALQWATAGINVLLAGHDVAQQQVPAPRSGGSPVTAETEAPPQEGQAQAAGSQRAGAAGEPGQADAGRAVQPSAEVSGQPGAGGESERDRSAGLTELLRLRYRIRNDLRLPEDDYDRMLDA
jgi:hypothetical protein